jgi:hypothetical protein
MAEFDDDRPDFDAVFGDEQEEPPLRRFPRPRRRRESEEPESASTGEVPRAGARARGGGPPPEEDDLDFGGLADEPRSRPRRSSSRSRGARPRGGRSRRGGRGGGGGGAVALQGPRGRLLLGIAFAVILVVVIVFVVKECQRNQLEDSYTSYLNDVAGIVTQSAEQGTRLRQVMANQRGDRPPQLKAKIQAIAGDARGLVDRAEDLDPPGALSGAQRSFVTALEYRVTGLSLLSQNLTALLQSNDQEFTALGLADGMQRFLASDVIYADSFEGPARAALEKDDITGIQVPKGQAFLPNPALAAEDGAKTLIPGLRRRGAQQGGGDSSGNLKGTSLVMTEAVPSGQRLAPGSVTTVQASDQLKWKITIENGGDFTETGVVVTATFSYPGTPNDAESKETSVSTIDPGDSTSVEIPGPTNPVFGEQGTLMVEIEPVSGETNTDNNRAEYPVKITI